VDDEIGYRNTITFMFFQVLVFDFQPKDPEDIYVALAGLSGRAIPGETRNLFIYL
jgi:hypothetical protein